ncbi:hypothetical protein SK128_007075, partial [Halocaridina rubra]
KSVVSRGSIGKQCYKLIPEDEVIPGSLEKWSDSKAALESTQKGQPMKLDEISHLEKNHLYLR